MALSLVALLGTANANLITSVDVTPNTGYPGHQQTITVHINDTSTHGHVYLCAHTKDYSRTYDSNSLEDDIFYYQWTGLDYGPVQNGVYTMTWSCPEPDFLYKNTLGIKYYDNAGTEYTSYVVLNIVPAKNIHEFPSVVVPLAAILGLVMIFGRKKEF